MNMFPPVVNVCDVENRTAPVPGIQSHGVVKGRRNRSWAAIGLVLFAHVAGLAELLPQSKRSPPETMPEPLMVSLVSAPQAAPERKKASATIEKKSPTTIKPKADTSSTGLKIEAAIRDIPQSISVVKKELVKSQNAFNLRDALKNVSGLTIAAGEGGRTGDSITLRGFAANSDTFLDGVRENGQYFRDTFFMDRVEVLKGASSVLFGRGSTGGVINSIAKKPRTGPSFATADFTYGNYDFKRTTLDVGTKLTENLAVRLNGLYQDANSFRDYNFTNRWGVAPSLQFTITPDTNLTLHSMDWQSYYFSRGTSFNPSAETFNLSTATANPGPERNQNDESEIELALPIERPNDAETLAKWLQAQLNIDREPGRIAVENAKAVRCLGFCHLNQQKFPGIAVEKATVVRWAGRKIQQPGQWRVDFQSPRRSIRAEYWVGNAFVSVKRQEANLFEFMTRLHKGVGMGIGWILLTVTLACGLVFLSVTGLLMWTKTRDSRITLVGLRITSFLLALIIVLNSF